MTSAQFAALDYAVNAVGDLTEKAIGGKEVVKQLVEAGLLEKKGKQFTLTATGRAAHAAESTPEHVKAREELAKREVMIRFLTKVEAEGKLAKKDAIPTDTIEEAKRLRYVAPGKKKDTFELLPTGKEHLRRCQAEEAQRAKHTAVADIRQKLHSQVADLQRQLKLQLDQLHEQSKSVMAAFEGSGATELESALSAIEQHNNHAAAEFSKVLSELAGFATLGAAVLRYQTLVSQKPGGLQDLVKTQQAQNDSSLQALRGQEAKLNELASTQQAKIDEFRRQTEAQLAEVEKKFRESAAANPQPAAAPQPAVKAPSESSVWEATKREYQRIHQENSRFGGIVGIPELSDAVRRSFADMTSAQFHEFLQGWERQDRLTLQLCSTPNQEPRSGEGIHSSRGLLLYVHLR